jgi:hypothetical protein
VSEKAKVPKPKGLKSSLKGLPPAALVGIPVAAGVAFWLYSRKKKSAATSTVTPATDTTAAPQSSSYGSGFGGFGYSDPYSFQNSLQQNQGIPSVVPAIPAATSDAGSQTNGNGQSVPATPAPVITPTPDPTIGPGGNMVVPPTPPPAPITPPPAETFITPPVKVDPLIQPPVYVAPTVINGKPVNPANLIPKGYTSGDYAATRAARVAQQAANAAKVSAPVPIIRTSVLSGGSSRGD